MIKLEIDGVHYEIDDDLRKQIIDLIGGLDEYMDTLQEGHVAVAWEGGANEQTKVTVELWGGGHNFDASATDWKAGKAIDQVRHKLEAQITKKHSKELDRRDPNPRK